MIEVLRLIDTAPGSSAVDAVAVDVLAGLFEGTTGAPPRSLRAYRDGDVLLLVLRFAADEPPVEAALIALAQLVCEGVARRTRASLAALSVSLSAERCLAVLAFGAPQAPAAEPVRLLRAS